MQDEQNAREVLGRAAYFRCTSSRTSLFAVGNAYEVYRYSDDGIPEVITEDDKCYVTLPHPDATLVPHDPWARYRAEHATAALKAKEQP